MASLLYIVATINVYWLLKYTCTPFKCNVVVIIQIKSIIMYMYVSSCTCMYHLYSEQQPLSLYPWFKEEKFGILRKKKPFNRGRKRCKKAQEEPQRRETSPRKDRHNIYVSCPGGIVPGETLYNKGFHLAAHCFRFVPRFWFWTETISCC